MVRPLHRWKSFWLGILVLVFLGWAWHRSTRYLESFRIANSTGSVGVVLYQRDSTVTVTVPGTMPIVPGVGPLSIPLPDPRNLPLTPPPLSVGRQPTIPYDHTISIAHWFLILGFLIPWAGFLVWRVRRVKRLAAGGAEPPARSST